MTRHQLDERDAEFAAWVRWVFGGSWNGDRSDLSTDLWPEEPSAHYPSDPVVRVEYLTRLFERSHDWLSTYSLRAVGLGLRFLCDPSLSSHMYALVDPAVELSARLRGVSAIRALFAATFAKSCEPSLIGDVRSNSAAYELNATCFDFWYLVPIVVADVEIGIEAMHVMSDVARLENPACVESALRGLGWNLRYYPELAIGAIDSVLHGRGTELAPQLREYAVAARRGVVS